MKKILLILFLFSTFAFTQNLIPTDDEVKNFIIKQVDEDYEGLFRIENFQRTNGFWKDSANFVYEIKCSYELISNVEIIIGNYKKNILLYTNLQILSFNKDIPRNTKIIKKQNIILQKSEKGWIEASFIKKFF